MNAYLRAALEYAERGWSVIPIGPGTKNPPKGVRWKQFQDRLPTVKQLQTWFGSGERYPAIILGDVSDGLICRDFDTPEGYPTWAAAYPELAAALPTVKTVKGCHVYARANIEQIRRASPSGGQVIFLGDGELRGGKCYCLAPPAIHPDGPTYQWLRPLPDEIPFVDLEAAGWLPKRQNQRQELLSSREAQNGSSPCNTENRVYTVSRENGANRENTDCAGKHRNTQEVRVGGSDATKTAQGDVAELVALAIERTTPGAGGMRHAAVFEFARELKAIPSLFDAAPRALKPYVVQWHKAALPTIQTKPFEETWTDFLLGWPRVKFPKGQGPIQMIYQDAMKAGMPPEAEGYEQEPLRNLVALCRQLQRVAGGEPFFLGCRTAAELLAVSHVQVWRWLYMLQCEGLLEHVERGALEQRKASRYRYLGEL